MKFTFAIRSLLGLHGGDAVAAAARPNFTQAYSASPLRSPTRSAIFTGLSPARTGITEPNRHQPQVVLHATTGKKSPPDQKAIQPSPVTL